MHEIRKFFKLYQSRMLYGGILTVCVSLIVFAIYPAARLCVDKYKAISELSGQVAALRVKVSLLEKLDEALIRRDLKALLAAVPSDKSIASVFSTVDGVSSQTGTTIADESMLAPGSLSTAASQLTNTEEQKLGTNIVEFSVLLQANLEQLHDFLAKIVTVRRFVHVNGIDVSFNGESSGLAKLTMNAYSAPLPTSLGKPEDPLELITAENQQILQKVSSMPISGGELTEPAAILNQSNRNPFSP